jgi:iron complex transport system ATP-binding protein
MHDLTLAGQYADRLLLLDRGRLVAAGSAADVLTRALIAEHYRADVRVVGEPESGLAVVPVRRTSGAGAPEESGHPAEPGALLWSEPTSGPW